MIVYHGSNIADDKVIQTINNYIEQIELGRWTKQLVEYTLDQLSYQEVNNQYCFATKRSLDTLTFVESYEVSVDK